MGARRRYACPCCGFYTLPERPPGTFLLCPVCAWEDDGAQFRNPSLKGGANAVSLDQARANFREFGAAEEKMREHVRAPLDSERP